MAANIGETCNRLTIAEPVEPETALKRLQKWNLMDTVPDWLLLKLSYAFVLKHPESKKYSGFLITDTDEVLVVGDNTAGLLALDSFKIRNVDRPLYNEELSKKGIIEIISMTCSFTIVARTSDGKIFTWGDNSEGQLGLGHTNITCGCSQVKGVLMEERVVQHCCGGWDTLCFTSSGKLVGWGSMVFPNISGAAPDHFYPFVITWLPSAPIKWIGATGDCFFALTVFSEVYSWGLSCRGRALSSDRLTPTIVQVPPEVYVKKVSCGFAHVLLLTSGNQLYTWGLNHSGQVGGNGIEDGTEVVIPQLIELNQRIEDILAVTSESVSFCKTSDGNVAIYEWGYIAGTEVFVPTATKYGSFEESLIANDLGMSSKWTDSPAAAEVEIKYKAIIKKSNWFQNEKKLLFSVSGVTIEACKFAAYRSPVMRRKLKTDWEDLVKDGKPIELEHTFDIDWLIYTSLMMFMHTDEVMTADEDLLDLVKLANHYEVFELGRKSAKKLEALITESNAMEIYQVAKKCGATGLVLVVLNMASGFFCDFGAYRNKCDPMLVGQLVSDLQDLKFAPKLNDFVIRF